MERSFSWGRQSSSGFLPDRESRLARRQQQTGCAALASDAGFSLYSNLRIRLRPEEKRRIHCLYLCRAAPLDEPVSNLRGGSPWLWDARCLHCLCTALLPTCSLPYLDHPAGRDPGTFGIASLLRSFFHAPVLGG